MERISIQKLVETYCNKQKHAQEVKRLSLIIFQEINEKIKNFSEEEKKLLEAAALLHDIGYSIEEKNHHKHTQKIILEYEILEFTPRQQLILSCICRYHKGELPDKQTHQIYSTLDKKERKTVKQLGGILKIADGLENKKLGEITNIKLIYDKKNNISEFILTLKISDTDNKSNIMRAIRKKDLFEIGFKTQVIFKIA